MNTNTEQMTPLKHTVRWCFPWLLLVGINGLGIAATFSDLPLQFVSGAVFTLIAFAVAISFIAERVLPYNRDWNRSHGDGWRDVVHFAVNESLSLGPAFVVPLFVVSAVSPNDGGIWPTEWPVIAQVLIAVVVFDLISNLVHWASHNIHFMWRFHAVHHEVKRMYGLNGILKHPIYQIVSGALASLPLALLGAPAEIGMTIAFLSVIQLLLQHSNVDYTIGIFRYLISSAEVHRFHHLRGDQGNVNFALYFAAFDHLFGNAYHSPRRLTTEDIGLEDCHYPTTWYGQMLAPFVRNSDETDVLPDATRALDQRETLDEL